MSKEILEAVKELTGKVDESKEAAVAAQEKFEELETQGVEMDATLKKMVEDSAKAAEEAQEVKQQLEAIETTQKYLEKMFSRMGGTEGEDNEAESKAAEEMAAYLRTGEDISPETKDMVTRSLCKKNFYGIGEEQRESEMKALIAGQNPEGGYWIRPERSATIIKRIFETSPLRTVANIETTASDTMELVVDDDEAASGGWVGETAPRTTTDTPQIGLLTIPAHEQFAQPKATTKMLQDAGFDIEGWLGRKVQDKMSRTENTAFVSGDGSQKPKGFLTYPAWAVADTYERFKLEQVNSGANGNFTGDGVKNLQNQVKEAYQSGAVFGIKRIEWQKIIILKDGNGAYLLDPRSPKTGDTLELLGKPVIFFDDMPIAATGSLSMVYGNFSMGYTIVDRIGFQVLRDPFTDKPFILFYTIKRTGGAVTNFESLKIQKLSA